MKKDNQIRAISLLICLILLMIIFGSCNPTKKIQKFVRKNGAKDVLSVLISDYPELFNKTTDTVFINKNVYVPEIQIDTVYSAPNCPELNYRDTNIIFQVKDNNVKYIIKERKIALHDTLFVDRKIPCPDINLLQKPKESEIKVIYKWFSWFAWILILLYIIYRILRKKLLL
jgi:hypothetical protein